MAKNILIGANDDLKLTLKKNLKYLQKNGKERKENVNRFI